VSTLKKSRILCVWLAPLPYLNIAIRHRIINLAQHSNLTLLIIKGTVLPPELASSQVIRSPFSYPLSVFGIRLPRSLWVIWSMMWIAFSRGPAYDVIYVFQDWTFFCGPLAKVRRKARLWVLDSLDDPALPLRTVEGQQAMTRNPRGAITKWVLGAADWCKGKLARRADGVVVTAVDLTDPLPHRLRHAYNIAADRMLLLTNGVDLSATRPSEQTRPHAAPFRVAYVGLVSPLRGLDVLLPAMARVRQHVPSAQLDLVGKATSADLRWFRQEVERQSLEGTVVYHGELPSAAAWRVIEAATVCVNPIHRPENAYAFPIKVYEYLAMGRPVVASDLPGIRGIIRHGENGVLVEPGNSIALADALIRLHGDGELRLAIAANARASVSEFDWPRVHVKLNRWLRELIAPEGTTESFALEQ
jgi:glycosyltransferase involved in cell wall biosynthesis